MHTKLITLILIAALIAIPANTATVIPKKDKQWVLQAFCAVVVIAAAGTMIYHLWKWCKKIPSGPPPEDPPEPGTTNTPPRQFNLLGETSIDPAKFIIETIPGDSIGYWDISGYTNQRGFDILMGTTLESSNDMTNWVVRYHLLGWCNSKTNSTDLIVSLFDTNWTRLATRTGSFTNEMVFSESMSQEPKQFYRLKKTERFHP